MQSLFHITFGNGRKVAPRTVKQITHEGNSHSVRSELLPKCLVQVSAVIELFLVGCRTRPARSLRFALMRDLRFRRSPHSSSVSPHSFLASPRWILSPTFDILNTCQIGEDIRQETGAHFYAQAHISTQPASPLEDARLSLTNEDQVGSCRAEPSPCSRTQARLSQCWLSRLSHSRRFVSAGAGSRA